MIQALVPASPPAAAFGGKLGYRFVADVVEFSADIDFYPPASAGLDWALQLWADDSIKIAELPLGRLVTEGLHDTHISGAATATLPAGDGLHALSMALVSGEGGVYPRCHDRRTFGLLEAFQQPRLTGAVACDFGADRIVIDIAGIENPRALGNISGTLDLEVWLLDTPYAGGAWIGTPIASLVIGQLHGGERWTDRRFEAHAAWVRAFGHLTLMLREWTPTGYVTRDYRPLPLPPFLPAEPPEPMMPYEPPPVEAGGLAEWFATPAEVALPGVEAITPAPEIAEYIAPAPWVEPPALVIPSEPPPVEAGSLAEWFATPAEIPLPVDPPSVEAITPAPGIVEYIAPALAEAQPALSIEPPEPAIPPEPAPTKAGGLAEWFASTRQQAVPVSPPSVEESGPAPEPAGNIAPALAEPPPVKAGGLAEWFASTRRKPRS